MADRIRSVMAYAVLIFWLAVVVVPILWIALNSFRGSREIFADPFGIPWIVSGVPEDEELALTPLEIAAQNYATAWVESGFSRFIVNSTLVTCLSLAGLLGCASLAAYSLARFRFRGSRALLVFFLTGMMIPAQLILIPLFFQFTSISELGSVLLRPFGFQLGLHDSLPGLVLVYITLGLPFTI